MTSIVIAAHNEERVIGKCLDALLAGARPGELDVIVVANGCTDRTAQVAAARSGVRVLKVPEAGKSRALNAGDREATGFPRVYLDADLEATTEMVQRLCAALEDPGSGGPRPLAVAPRRVVDAAGRPRVVRAYFAINSRLPAYRGSLFGRGMFVLSAEGRARFGVFPEVVADDLFVDAQFTAAEKLQVDDVVMRVPAPLRTRDLVRRLVRVRRGGGALRASAARGEVTGSVRSSDRWSWLRDVVVPAPWLAPAAVVYVTVTLVAAALARRGSPQSWERDDSTRQAEAESR
ncbi:glycosyltransferase family 2 protein [Georgenia thermotolerans]|uniref:4,4'-diaponeurosporenoate glycosyltransferase n=1 Tax=Georgenia thermotolerans TaxID=527326 RepID=A0A7J5UST4_9MICO|nr:glycosyltransferase [Georgenia thermotolerans]KAE8764893.1 glycosyltransferase [Georgenia thermotolerans]